MLNYYYYYYYYYYCIYHHYSGCLQNLNLTHVSRICNNSAIL